MPLMKSLRSFRLETTTGHVIEFAANEPIYVPDSAVPFAMQAGCVPEDAADLPFYEDTSRANVEFQGDVRKSVLYLAVQAVCKKNDSKDFDGAGTPKVAVIAAKLGYEVNQREVTDAMQLWHGANAEGVEPALHPAAANITRVLEAESKMELVELANEFDLPESKTKGLSVRDLRKLLLVKFSGVTA